MPMIQSLVSSTGKMRSVSRSISRNAWQSSRSACTRKRPASSSSADMLQDAGQSGARASRRRSISWANALLQHQEGRRRLPPRAQDTEKAAESQAPGDQGDTTTAQAYAD